MTFLANMNKLRNDADINSDEEGDAARDDDLWDNLHNRISIIGKITNFTDYQLSFDSDYRTDNWSNTRHITRLLHEKTPVV